jgi:hypothetical protein
VKTANCFSVFWPVNVYTYIGRDYFVEEGLGNTDVP